LAPDFPTLKSFLRYWEREIKGPLHSVGIAHHRLLQPAEWRHVAGKGAMSAGKSRCIEP
jgi:uncharacterized protein Usg